MDKFDLTIRTTDVDFSGEVYERDLDCFICEMTDNMYDFASIEAIDKTVTVIAKDTITSYSYFEVEEEDLVDENELAETLNEIIRWCAMTGDED